MATPAFETTNNIQRIFISNGLTNVTIEEYMPLGLGLNLLKFEDNTFVELHKEDSECGVYVKWLNQYGAYNYWLFENNAQDVETRTLKTINNDCNNLEDTVSQSKALGKTSRGRMNVLYEQLNVHDIKVLQGILQSPKVYMYTGERFAPNTAQNWLEVHIGNKTIPERNFKDKVPNGAITFQLPEHYNIIL